MCYIDWESRVLLLRPVQAPDLRGESKLLPVSDRCRAVQRLAEGERRQMTRTRRRQHQHTRSSLHLTYSLLLRSLSFLAGQLMKLGAGDRGGSENRGKLNVQQFLFAPGCSTSGCYLPAISSSADAAAASLCLRCSSPAACSGVIKSGVISESATQNLWWHFHCLMRS